MLSKVSGYNSQNIMAACPICHSVLCAHTITLVFVDGNLLSRKQGSNGFLMRLKHGHCVVDLRSFGEQSHPKMRKAVGSFMTYSNQIESGFDYHSFNPSWGTKHFLGTKYVS